MYDARLCDIEIYVNNKKKVDICKLYNREILRYLTVESVINMIKILQLFDSVYKEF